MDLSSENLRFILGMKLRQLRHDQGYSLKELAAKTGLSFSYLSEIEKGKKYPKPVKLIEIAKALNVSFDEIVSSRVDPSLDSLTALLNTAVIKEFPFELFGITPSDVLELVRNSPQEAGALIRTFLEIGRFYNMGVEQFLFAALRSYQKMNNNYFEDIEVAARTFEEQHPLIAGKRITVDLLKSILTQEYGCVIDEFSLDQYPELKGFRSVWLDGNPPRLFLNPRLLPVQKAFILAHKIGFDYMKLKKQAITSTWLKVESFEQVLNNFKASYFAGALLIHRDVLYQELQTLFQRRRWSSKSFLGILRKFQATPEMFSYRLSQLIPHFFGLDEMFYLRFNNEAGSDDYSLTKELNMSRVIVPHGIGLNEHYCRRWLSIGLLKDLARHQRQGKAGPILAGVQRSRFLESGAKFFVISLARPLVLSENTNSSISLGFLINETFQRTVAFWDDPGIAEILVNETCERCALAPKDCKERVAQPVLYEKEQVRIRKEQALDQLRVEFARDGTHASSRSLQSNR